MRHRHSALSTVLVTHTCLLSREGWGKDLHLLLHPTSFSMQYTHKFPRKGTNISTTEH